MKNFINSSAIGLTVALLLLSSAAQAEIMWVTCPSNASLQCEASIVPNQGAAQAALPDGRYVVFTGNQRPATQGQVGAPQQGGALPQRAYGAAPQQAYGGFPQQAYGAAPQQAYGGFPQQAYGALPQQAYGGLPQQRAPQVPPQAYGSFPQQPYMGAPQVAPGGGQIPVEAQYPQCNGRWQVEQRPQPNGMMGWVKVCQYYSYE